MAKTFELMEEHMPAPSGNKPVAGGPSSRVSELGIVLPGHDTFGGLTSSLRTPEICSS
jgi:hypothetical protein